MIIKDVMKKNVISIEPEATATEAKELMKRHGIGKLPVIKNGRLVGIITKNDLLQAGPSLATTLDMYEISYLLSKLTVKKIMTQEVATVDANEVVEEAARIMVEKRIGCLPVLKDSVVVGIITESDLFRLFTQMFGSTTTGIRAVLTCDDTPGQIARISEKIAAHGGNIISVVTSEGADKPRRVITLKVNQIDIASVERIFKELANLEVADIRPIA